MSLLAAWKLPFGGSQSGATATGTVQGDALAITASNVELTTVAANTGARLPTAERGMRIVVSNRGANTLKLYPATGAAVDGLGANNPYSIAANSQVLFVACTTTQWYAIQTSGGSGTALSETITVANAFAAGNVIKHTAGAYSKAQADSAANAEVFGVLSAATGANFTIYYMGKMTLTAHGFTDAAVLFLSAGTAGLLTETEPSTAGQVSKPIAIVYDANTLLIIPSRGMVIPAATLPSIVGKKLQGLRAKIDESGLEYYSATTFKKSVNQVAHTLSAEDIVRHNGTIWVKAQGDSAANSEATGVVETVTDADNFVVVLAGEITLSAKTANTEYFIDATTAGLLTSLMPSASTTITRSVLRMTTTTLGIVRISPIGIQN